MSAQKKASRRREPGFQELAAIGVSPQLATLVTEFVAAEAAWSKVNRRPDRLWIKAKDPKRKAALDHGGSHPLRKAADAAWAKVERAEKAILRYRPRTWAEVVVKRRLWDYVGRYEQLLAEDILPLMISDAARLPAVERKATAA